MPCASPAPIPSARCVTNRRPPMFRNYLVTALRNIVRHKLYSAINITGLAVGLACAVFIALFIQDELSYDKWVPDTAGLYQIDVTLRPHGLPPMITATAPFPL